MIAVADCWFDDVAMAWEIDSREWHISPAEYEATLARRAAMVASGTFVLATPPSRIRSAGRAMLDELHRAYSQTALRPRPDLRAVPTSTG